MRLVQYACMTQAEALRILSTGANVFLTGEPGSGKTHTINAYVAWLRARGIEPALTASTGIAATHIHGMTIHAWSGIGIKESLSPEDLDQIAAKEPVARRVGKTDVLIIDEVSMLSGETLTMVDQVCREVRRREEPFGGMQVVLVGDFFQLPPISRRGAERMFAFAAPAWRRLNPIICYLSEQHRQEDAVFLNLLGAIRGGLWDESHAAHLMRREAEHEAVDGEVPRLYTHNEDVDRINEERLMALKGAGKTFVMEEGGTPAMVEGLKRGCLSPERLTLKEGALVMCTKNNPAAGYVNGTVGRVTAFERGTDYPIITTTRGDEITMAPQEWALEQDGKVRAKITQVPLRLAWAITIHKSQGQSLDEAAVDLSRVFEYGQGYVALSRVRTLEGLHLLGWSDAALKMHPEVMARDEIFREASEEAARMFEALEETGERLELERNFIKAVGGTLEPSLVAHAPRVKKSTYDETLALLDSGMSYQDVAHARSLTLGTIADHAEKLVSSKRLSLERALHALPVPLREALPQIHAAFDRVGHQKLQSAFAHLKGAYSYDELKLARAVYVDSDEVF